MSETNKIFIELSKDMGFEIKGGRIVTAIGGNDRKRMRQDLKNIGHDMRVVLSRCHG